MKHVIHDHPAMEQRLGVDSKHVIVDREEYVKAKMVAECVAKQEEGDET